MQKDRSSAQEREGGCREESKGHRGSQEGRDHRGQEPASPRLHQDPRRKGAQRETCQNQGLGPPSEEAGYVGLEVIRLCLFFYFNG